jgi:hypothetical protein
MNGLAQPAEYALAQKRSAECPLLPRHLPADRRSSDLVCESQQREQTTLARGKVHEQIDVRPGRLFTAHDGAAEVFARRANFSPLLTPSPAKAGCGEGEPDIVDVQYGYP